MDWNGYVRPLLELVGAAAVLTWTIIFMVRRGM